MKVSVQHLFSFNYYNYLRSTILYKWFLHSFIKQVLMEGYYVPDSFNTGANDTLLKLTLHWLANMFQLKNPVWNMKYNGKLICNLKNQKQIRGICFFKKGGKGTVLVVQWLRLCFYYKEHEFNPCSGKYDPTCCTVYPKSKNKK